MSTRVVPIVRPTPHALVPAVLPDSIGELQALNFLDLSGNKIAGTCFCVVPIVRLTPHVLVPAALPSTIGDLEALEALYAGNNALTGTCFCSTNCALTALPLQLCQSQLGSFRRSRSSTCAATKLPVRTRVVPAIP